MSTPAGTRPRLRPLSFGETLDVSIKILIRNAATLFKAVLVVVVPIQILSTLLTADMTTSSFDFTPDPEQTPEEALEELNQFLGGFVISTLLQMVAVLLASAACFRAIAQAYLGEVPDWRGSLSYALRHAPALLWLSLLSGLGTLVGLLFFIGPGIWLYFAWAFATPALLVEGLRGRAALARSFGLVKGRWWRTFGVLVFGFLIAGVLTGIVQAIFLVGIVFDPENQALVLVLSALSGIVGLAIGTPFQAALLSVVYFDLRVRKEAFDLELLAQGIGGSVPAVPVTSGPSPLLPSDKEAAASANEPAWPAPPGSEDPLWPAPPGSEDPPWPPPPGSEDLSRAAPPGSEDPPWPPPRGSEDLPPAAPPGSGDVATSDPSTPPRPRFAPRDDEDDEPPRLPGVPLG